MAFLLLQLPRNHLFISLSSIASNPIAQSEASEIRKREKVGVFKNAKAKAKASAVSAKMMRMTFYWGKKVTILFDSWRTDSWTSYIISLAACFLVAVFYQYLEDRRIRFKLLSAGSRESNALTTPLLQKLGSGRWKKYGLRFVGSVLFGVNSAIGYMLMLAVMSFNWGVFLAIVVGLAVGFGVFRFGDNEDDGVGVAGGDSACACT